MSQKQWMSILGLTVADAINTYHYPSLNEQLVTDRHIETLRKMFYRTPKDSYKLQKLMTRLILKGHIDEIAESDRGLNVYVQIKYKGERYLVLLTLAELKWQFRSIQYIGEVNKPPVHKTFAFWVVIAIIGLIMTYSVFFMDTTQTASKQVEDNNEWTSTYSLPATSRSLSINETNNHTFFEHEDGYSEVNNNIDTNSANSTHTSDSSNLSNSIDLGDTAEQPNNEVTFTIKTGMSAEDVSSVLFEHGLVRSPKEVEDLFILLGLDTKIQSGTYSIVKDATYAEIISIITQ